MKAKITMICAMALFGSIGLFVKNIALSSGAIALYRGFLGSVFLILAVIILKKPLNYTGIKKNLLILALSGAAIGFNWIFLFQAYKYTTIANATLSYYFAPVFVVLLSPFILKERLSLVSFLGVVAAVCGLFMLVGFDASAGSGLVIGIGYGLLAAALYAAVILLNKFIKNLEGLETTLVQLIMATLILLPYIAATEGILPASIDLTSIVLVIIVGIVHTGFGYFLYFSSLRKLPGQTVASLSYIDPATAIILAAVFLGETLGLIQMAGAVLILGATFVTEGYRARLGSTGKTLENTTT